MARKTFANLRRPTRARGQRKGRECDVRKPVKRPVRAASAAMVSVRHRARAWCAAWVIERSEHNKTPHNIRQWKPWMGWRVRIYWAHANTIG